MDGHVSIPLVCLAFTAGFAFGPLGCGGHPGTSSGVDPQPDSAIAVKCEGGFVNYIKADVNGVTLVGSGSGHFSGKNFISVQGRTAGGERLWLGGRGSRTGFSFMPSMLAAR